MADMPRVGDLEIDQDLAFQRREWLFERLAWAAMALLTLAALLGLLGRGPLSPRRASAPDGSLSVEYERFLNSRSDTTLTVRVPGEVTRARTFRLWINDDYLDRVQVRQITPRPEREEPGSGRHAFVFRAAEPGQPASVTFRVEPDRAGRLQAEVAAGQGEPAALGQIVYP
jgi:hypothetical protein